MVELEVGELALVLGELEQMREQLRRNEEEQLGATLRARRKERELRQARMR